MTMMSTGTPESEPVKTSIAPWLSVSQAAEAVDYYKAAFGAVERYRLEDDAGKVVVAQLAIGGADFWLQEDIDSSPESLDRRSVRTRCSSRPSPQEQPKSQRFPRATAGGLDASPTRLVTTGRSGSRFADPRPSCELSAYLTQRDEHHNHAPLPD